MDQKKIFETMPAPPAGLAVRIMLRIARKRRRCLTVKAWAFGAALAGSVSLIVYGSFAAAADASRSGFLVFSSLLFSDFSATAANFSDFLLSVAESFPVFSAAILLSGVFVAIWSAAKFAKEIALLRGQAPAGRFAAQA